MKNFRCCGFKQVLVETVSSSESIQFHSSQRDNFNFYQELLKGFLVSIDIQTVNIIFVNLFIL